MALTNIDQLKSKLTGSDASGQVTENLCNLDNGSTYCLHHAWGLGEVKSYSPEENRLIVDFPESGKKDHKMAPEFFLTKCEVLPANHILSQFKENPAQILDWAKHNRVELVKAILASSAFVKLIDTKNHVKIIPKKNLEETLAKIDELERPTVTSIMTNSEIESILSHILIGEDLKKWWTAAKKELQKDEYVGTPAKKDGYYELREKGQTVNPEQEVLEEFFREKKPKRKIELVMKLFAFSANEELPKALPGQPQPLFSYSTSDPATIAKLHNILDDLTVTLKDAKRLNAAERLHGIWVRNDLCRFFRGDVDQLEPTSTSIITAEKNAGRLSQLAKDIPQDTKYLKRLLDLLSRIYKDPREGEEDPQWLEVVLELLGKADSKFANECILFLCDRKKAQNVCDLLKTGLDNQDLSSALLIWVIKNRNNPKFKDGIKPLLTHRLLSLIFRVIDRESIAASNSRKNPLAEEVRTDYNLINDLLADADENVARDLAQSLKMIQGYSELAKKSLLSRFIKVYKSIENLVEGQHQKSSTVLYVSVASLKIKQDELADLIDNKIPENKRAIQEARELGDLSENSEYKMARQNETVLNAKKEGLEKEISNARVTDFSSALEGGKISMGTIVKIRSASGTEATYTILGAWDSDTQRNILSYNTRLAQQLIGKSKGDELYFNDENWTIVDCARWIDQAGNSVEEK
ncbi:MAG: GreA/GreB family elongation factor [Opitutales bacterium]|nr:GreA/GreB family elongation factor [Opitutales bacterium]